MHLTIMSIVRHLTTTIAAILLAACANLDVDRTAERFDEDTYANDLSDCRGGPALVFAADRLESTLVGSAYGFVLGVYHGAIAGDSSEGAVIGTIVGGAVGLGVGGYDAISEHDRELAQCLRGKGYAIETL